VQIRDVIDKPGSHQPFIRGDERLLHADRCEKLGETADLAFAELDPGQVVDRAHGASPQSLIRAGMWHPAYGFEAGDLFAVSIYLTSLRRHSAVGS
jgi:hypothetical protein